jgi:hypothetical protein
MIDSIHDKIDTLGAGTGAAAIVQVVHDAPAPDLIKTIIQILVGVVTLWHLFKKNKSKDATSSAE